jgi:prophage regulatory protein
LARPEVTGRKTGRPEVTGQKTTGRRLLDYQALKARGIPWSRVHIKRLEAARKFPLHIDVGDNSIAWFEDEIDDFLEMKAVERDLRKGVDETRGEMMLRQVWNSTFAPPAKLREEWATFGPWEEIFIIDESMASEVARQIASPADRAAALDCWRNKMVAAIDAVVRRYKGGATAPPKGFLAECQTVVARDSPGLATPPPRYPRPAASGAGNARARVRIGGSMSLLGQRGDRVSER